VRRERLKNPRYATVVLEKHQLVGLKILSKKEGVEQSTLMRRALDQFLERELPRYGVDYEKLKQRILEAEAETDLEKILEVTGT